MDGAVLGADRGVAALRLHRPEIRLVERLLRSEAVAVGDLVEAVLHSLRADLNRLEEDVVLRVTRHLANASFGANRNRHSPAAASGLQASAVARVQSAGTQTRQGGSSRIRLTAFRKVRFPSSLRLAPKTSRPMRSVRATSRAVFTGFGLWNASCVVVTPWSRARLATASRCLRFICSAYCRATCPP